MNVLLRSEARGDREGIIKFGSMEITDKILMSYFTGIIDVQRVKTQLKWVEDKVGDKEVDIDKNFETFGC